VKTAIGRGLLLILSFSLVISIFASAGIIGVVQASGPTYTTHSAIHINNNGDLAALKSSGDSTGSGLVGDPYVIKGYDITGTGGTCIYIGNTTKYLVISDCRLHGNNAGIELFIASHVTVSNNICSGNGAYGIHTSAASQNVIENNTLTGAGRDDMFFQDSNNNIIQNNTSTGSSKCSNWLSNSNNNTFSNNTSSGSYGGCGLQVQSSDYNTVTNNTLTGNAEYGIRVFDSSNHNTVVHNICGDNDVSGIGLTSATNNSVSYNICTGNSVYGIAQYNSSGNSIYGNEIIRNNGASSSFNASHYQAYDDGTNHWNSLSYGNFWGDWTTPDANHDGIVDHPYPISGAGARDYLPTVSSQGLHFIISGPSQALKGGNVSWSFQVRNDGIATLLNVVVLDPLLNKTWTLGDVASGTSLQWSDQSVIPSFQNFTNKAYATATDVYGGTYNVSESYSITVLGPPSPPQGLTITARDSAAILNWTTPSSIGTGPITDYRIFRGTSTGGESYLGHTSSGSARTFNDSGLTNGQTYYYQVSAVNLAGEGPRCSEKAAKPTGLATAPGNLQATPGNGQVVLVWSAPTSNGGATIDYYLVYVNGVVRSEHYATTSATVTGLVNGVSYGFAVAAHNSVGLGPRSSIGTAVPSPDKTVPGMPTGITVTPGNSQISLSWTVPSSNGGDTIDFYLVYVNGVVRTEHYTTLSQTFIGLVNGQQYAFAVAAHNSVGIGPMSSVVNATPSPAPTVPGAPTELIATPGDAQVSLSWMAPANNGGVAVDHYIVYRDGVDVAHPIASSMIVTGLVNGQSYNFTVAAHSSVGTGERTSAVTVSASSNAPVPGTPTGLITMLGDRLVKLTWTAPPGSSGIDYYIVYQDGVDVAHPSDNSTTITGLTSGQNYTFAVAAHNAYGTGIRSSEQAITASGSNGATTPPGDVSMVILIGVLALIAAVIAIVMLVRKKKGR
jgi:parallel beta-helix repeat protein